MGTRNLFLYPFRHREWWGKKQQINTWLQARCHQQNFGVLIMCQFTQHWACWRQMGYTTNGKKDLCAGVSRTQWKSFKWVSNGEKDKPGSLEKSLGAAQQCLLCTSEVLWSAISVDVGNGESSNSRDGRVIDVLETVEKVKNDHTGINNLPHKRGVFARVCSSEGRNWVCLHNLNSTQL